MVNWLVSRSPTHSTNQSQFAGYWKTFENQRTLLLVDTKCFISTCPKMQIILTYQPFWVLQINQSCWAERMSIKCHLKKMEINRATRRQERSSYQVRIVIVHSFIFESAFERVFITITIEALSNTTILFLNFRSRFNKRRRDITKCINNQQTTFHIHSLRQPWQ